MIAYYYYSYAEKDWVQTTKEGYERMKRFGVKKLHKGPFGPKRRNPNCDDYATLKAEKKRQLKGKMQR